MGHILSRMAVTASLATALSLPAAAATSTWQIDPAHSSAQFAVKHLSISTVRGAFTSVKGSVQFDDQDVSKSSVDVTIDVASVDTRVSDRDKDLRSDHFFDVVHFPTIIFKSKKVEQVSPGRLKVTGNITIHGTTKEVVLDVDGPSAAIKDPWGNQRMGINASAKISRQDFGVGANYPSAMIGDEISITIDAEMFQKTK
ncbi:MAG TPA: YceI family protein [Candidatus Methylomirabilis sp.]|nr:YceI family protein [Candidatus Methylomirabilis sp.]